MGQDDAGPIRYWKPAPAMQEYVSGYFRFAVDLANGAAIEEVFLPGWPKICFTISGERPWALRIRNNVFGAVPPAAFIGPTSHAGYLTTWGGTLVGVGVLPCAWEQIFGGDLSRHANRVVPLDAIDPSLASVGAAIAGGADPVAAFDAWFAAALLRRPGISQQIRRLAHLLADPAITQVRQIVEEMDIAPRTLTDVTTHSFGFPPKLLLRRRRFLHALGAVLTRPEEAGAILDAAGYFDRSHFLRDSNLFLGCSPREFNKRRSPLNAMAMHARRETIGAPY
jgi:AraC-like DNA-binding protein